MQTSFHAGERFLQRVMSKTAYTNEDVFFAMRYIDKLLSDVVVNSTTKHFVLPGFEQYKAVCIQNRIVTIIPKAA